METIRFARIGKEDLVLGSGAFQVPLANGQVASLRKLDLGYFYDDVSTVAELPSTASTGTLRRVTDGTGLLYIFNGTTWKPLANFWAGTTQGDILIADSNGDPSRLAIGTALQMLLVNSGATALEYVASPQSVLSATGHLLYASAANTLAGLAIGAEDSVLKVSSGVPAWGTVSLPRGYLAGLGLSNNGTDSDHDIDIAVGVCRDTANSLDMELTSAFTKQIDANWSIGSGNGGFPSGLTLAVDTWYHLFLVDDSGGNIDAGFDTNIAATNLLSDTGGSKYRLIGSVLTDGSSNIIAFTQNGDDVSWSIPVADITATNPGTSAVLATLSTPSGRIVQAYVTAKTDNDSTGGIVGLLTDPAIADTAPTGDLHNFGSAIVAQNVEHPNPLYVYTNSSSQVRYRISASSTNDTVKIVTFGWIDRRGRDD